MEVDAVHGTVRIQRSSGGEWQALERGSQVGNDDVVEIRSEGSATLSMPSSGRVVLGRETKVMVTVSTAGRRDPAQWKIGLNLLGGSLLVETLQPCTVGIFTPSAVVELTHASVAAVVDGLTNETGVSVFAGDSVLVRNVTDRDGKLVAQGQSAVVVSGRPPAVPETINDDHLTILRHFLGDTLVDQQVAARKVRPKPAAAGGVEALPGGREVVSDIGSQSRPRRTTYPLLFSANKVYGHLLEDRARIYRPCRPVSQRGPLFDNHWSVGLRGGAAVGDDQVQGLLALTGAFRWRFIDFGLRVQFDESRTGWAFHQFKDGIDGALDVIDHVTIGWPRDSLYLTVGPIADLTMGDGIVVRRFSNWNPYTLYHPVGMVGAAQVIDLLTFQGFIGDITDFTYGGIRAQLQAYGYGLALGYYYDADQNNQLPQGEGLRFSALPDTVPDRDEEVHVAELGFYADILQDYRLTFTLSADGAYRFNTIAHSDGYVLRLPTLAFGWRAYQFGAGYVREEGRLITGMFGWNYPTNRYRVVELDGTTTTLTQNGILDRDRLTQGFRLFCRAEPVAGLGLACEYRQDVKTQDVFDDPNLKTKDNYSLFFEAAVNEALVPFMKIGRLRFEQVFGGLYPPSGSFADNWGFHTELYLLTVPLVANIAFEGGFHYYTLDFGAPPDFEVEAGERVFEFSLGARWGFR
ncbi:MAG: hypothetical protein GF331_23025 [Chitinivibrionales bacterium]|nr:hypothetical protein [Chitinivibrionales bacterium]